MLLSQESRPPPWYPMWVPIPLVTEGLMAEQISQTQETAIVFLIFYLRL